MANSGFWETMNVLIGTEWKRNGNDVMDDVHDWVDKVIFMTKSNHNSHDDENGDDHGSERKLQRKFSICYDNDKISFDNDNDNKKIDKFFNSLNLPKIECNFSHPRVRSRLERLMGSNLVSLTDRQYMLKLQERILQDYANEMDKQIKAREAEERERVKRLVLNGTIPLKKAPPEMAEHPIMLIEHYCNRIIAEMRKDIIKIPKIVFPEYMYPDDTPDPPPGLSVERGHIYRSGDDRLCKAISTSLSSSEEDDIKNQYMYNEEEYAKLKYQSPIIKELMACETVEQMYALADEILGVLQEFRELEEEEQTHDIPRMVSTMIDPVVITSERQRTVKLA